MNRLGCDVQFLALGLPETKHLRWAEPSRMTVEDSGSGPLRFAPKVIQIETSVFHPDITESHSLIDQIPYEGTSSAVLNERDIDRFCLENGTDIGYGFQTNNRVLYQWDPFSFGSPQKPTGSTKYSEEILYPDAPGIEDDVLVVADNNKVGKIQLSDGVYTNYFETGYRHQGLAVIPDGASRTGNVIFWVPGDAQLFEVDQSGSVQQKWTVSEMSGDEAYSMTYTSTGSSGQRYIYVLDDSKTVRKLRLQPNSDSYTQLKTFDPKNPIHISSAVSEDYFTVIEDTDVNPQYLSDKEVRVSEVRRYGDSNGYLLDETSIERYVLRQRGVGERVGYQGDRFIPPNDDTSVDIKGKISGTLSNDDIKGEIVYPAPYSTIKLEDAYGQITLLTWGGSEIRDSGAVQEDPEISINDDGVWKVHISFRRTENRPKLRVTDPAPVRALGARRGGWVEDCSDRVIPIWSVPANAITTEDEDPITKESSEVIVSE